MAEGWAKALQAGKYNFYSAGTEKHGLNPHAITVMHEVGIDISEHDSKTTGELPDVTMDYVFTVCSDAHENCPFFPGGKIIHMGFDDPPYLTKDMQSEDEILSVYRRVRDEIKDFISQLDKYLN